MEKTGLDITNKKTWYFVDKKNMVLHQKRWGGDGTGKGDALWRTSMAYIAYGHSSLLKGIESCFQWKDLYIQAYRYPGDQRDDVSRDQITAALAALKIRKQMLKLEEYALFLRRRISKKFRITADMSLWMKSLYAGKFYGVLFCLLSMYHPIGLVWNRILYKLIGIKVVSQEDYKCYDNLNIKWTYKLRKLRYRMYGFHLFCWQLYTSPDNFLKRMLERLCLPLVDKDNYMLRLLLKGRVSIKDIVAYTPMNEIRWQDELLHPNNSALCKLFPEDCKHNAVDNDLLWWYINRHPEQLIVY